eukprot:gene1751-biopygen1230
MGGREVDVQKPVPTRRPRSPASSAVSARPRSEAENYITKFYMRMTHCEEGHVLQPRKVENKLDVVVCSLCTRELDSGEGYLRCDACDFDQCADHGPITQSDVKHNILKNVCVLV